LKNYLAFLLLHRELFGSRTLGSYSDSFKYFSEIFTEVSTTNARPPLSAIASSDQINDQSLGMQILNELMKIKNGHGERVCLISKTSLPPNDPATARIPVRPGISHCPRGDLIVSSPQDLLGRNFGLPRSQIDPAIVIAQRYETQR